jgi:hypothetical protein
MIDTSIIRERLDYDPATGIFRWKISPCRRLKKGDLAGAFCKGYRVIKIGNKTYRAARLAWQYVYGEEPPNEIDHINGVKNDDWIENLRCATHQENCCNRKRRSDNVSGHKGVSWDSRASAWQAQVMAKGIPVHLGYYENPEEAGAAYRSHVPRLHGEFSNTGD